MTFPSEDQLPAGLPALHEDHLVGRAEEAYRLEETIVRGIAKIRSEWADLAKALYEFGSGETWKALGYESLGQWLAAPDIELSRRTYFALSSAYQQLVVERGVPMDALRRCDVSKVAEVLPAVRRGQIEPDAALADVEALTRTDLRDKYSAHSVTAGHVADVRIAPDAFHYENCPSCGSKIRVRDE